MKICPSCGAQHSENYMQCPNCGAPLAAAAPVNNGGYIPPAYQEEPVTTMGQWFGWWLLCTLLPLIGAIILLNVTKDPSVKNFAKLNIILSIIGIVIGFICVFIIIAAVGAMS